MVFGREQGLLRLQHGDEVDRAFAQPGFGQAEGFARAVDDELLQALALGPVGDGDERDLHVAEAGEDRLAIDLQQLELPALRQFQLPLQPEAVEQRLR